METSKSALFLNIILSISNQISVLHLPTIFHTISYQVLSIAVSVNNLFCAKKKVVWKNYFQLVELPFSKHGRQELLWCAFTLIQQKDYEVREVFL